MSADDGAFRFRHFRQAAAQNLFQDFRRAGRGKRQNGERRNWPAAHRVHIAECVGGGYLTEKLGVINNRCEKIHGLHDGEIIGEPINRRVVAGFEADKHIGIELRRKTLEYRVENAGAQFCCAACGFCRGGETNLFRQCVFSVEQIERL